MVRNPSTDRRGVDLNLVVAGLAEPGFEAICVARFTGSPTPATGKTRPNDFGRSGDDPALLRLTGNREVRRTASADL